MCDERACVVKRLVIKGPVTKLDTQEKLPRGRQIPPELEPLDQEPDDLGLPAHVDDDVLELEEPGARGALAPEPGRGRGEGRALDELVAGGAVVGPGGVRLRWMGKEKFELESSFWRRDLSYRDYSLSELVYSFIYVIKSLSHESMCEMLHRCANNSSAN